MSTQSTTARREGVTAVHSLDHFVFSVPDLDEAARFYDDFGLDVRHSGDKLHLHTAGHPHRWAWCGRLVDDHRFSRGSSPHRARETQDPLTVVGRQGHSPGCCSRWRRGPP